MLSRSIRVHGHKLAVSSWASAQPLEPAPRSSWPPTKWANARFLVPLKQQALPASDAAQPKRAAVVYWQVEPWRVRRTRRIRGFVTANP
jgi:hypothetical protein